MTRAPPPRSECAPHGNAPKSPFVNFVATETCYAPGGLPQCFPSSAGQWANVKQYTFFTVPSKPDGCRL